MYGRTINLDQNQGECMNYVQLNLGEHDEAHQQRGGCLKDYHIFIDASNIDGVCHLAGPILDVYG